MSFMKKTLLLHHLEAIVRANGTNHIEGYLCTDASVQSRRGVSHGQERVLDGFCNCPNFPYPYSV